MIYKSSSSFGFTHTQAQKITWWHDRGFNIIKHKYDDKDALELTYNINKVTTGNDFRLSKNRSHYDLRKFSFTNRTVNIWNSLPNAVVDVDSVNLFKSRLNNFWMSHSQDVKYDYTVNLDSTGDRSEYDIESYWKVVFFKYETDIEAQWSLRLSTSLTWLDLSLSSL